MKRFLSLLLAALMLISCATTLAEAERYKELGFAIDFSSVQNQSVNYPYMKNYGVITMEPFTSVMDVAYFGLPRNIIETIDSMDEDSEGMEEFYALKNAFTTTICEFVTTNAKSLDELGGDNSILAQCEVTEFGTQGDYHYYMISMPMDSRLTELFDSAEDTGDDDEHSPQAMKAAMLADIETVRAELMKQIQTAEFFEPVNSAAEFIGQTVEFESTDLDGNVVRSADLFKDNKVTMINIWGTWCSNCMNEMGELAEIHRRLQEKGCGIIGIEYERDTTESTAEMARKVLADNGVTYPNVWMPKDNPVFDQVKNFPFSLFVDSEGRILTFPIKGAAVKDYEPTIEKLLAGDAVNDAPATGSAKNESGEYRVIVYDTEGNPVKGVIVQLCDESTCSFQKTKADGIATFQVEAPKVYDVHIGKVPDGYVVSDEAYRTQDTFSDVNIFISKAE